MVQGIRPTLLLSPVILLSACEPAPVNPRSSPELIPLAPGNQWVYESIVVDSLGSIVATFADITREIYGDTLIDGERWFRTDRFCLVFAANREDGFWQRSFPSPTCFTAFVPPFRRLAYPLERHQTALVGTEEQTLVADDVLVTVPAGKFRCFQYMIRDTVEQWPDHYRYYAPGIGMILETWKSGDTAIPGTFFSRLKSVRLVGSY